MYYLNYLYGFLSSAGCFALLHWTFPDVCVDAFVKGPESAKEIMYQHHLAWDGPTAAVSDNQDVVSHEVEGPTKMDMPANRG